MASPGSTGHIDPFQDRSNRPVTGRPKREQPVPAHRKGLGPNCDSCFRNIVHQAEFPQREDCMCLIAWLILGLIAGWFVAAQGVNNGGASNFRAPPPQIFRPRHDNHPRPRQSQCSARKRFNPSSVSPEVLEPVRCQGHTDRRARDRTVPEPPLNRPSIVPPVRQRVAAGMATHVWVDLRFETEAPTRCALDHCGEARVG